MRRPAAAATALIVCLLGATPVSLARLASTSDASGSFATGTIDAPTGLAASTSGTTVTLTWTPTSTTAVTGYDVLRSTTSGSGFAVVSTVTPRLAATTTNSPGSGSFFYVLQSIYQNWRSASSNEATATVGTSSTGLKDCSSTAADTGGDGDGYQAAPGSACVVDGVVATDASSGTSAVLDCANAGKDRHRFWGYAFGLPGGVSSINGITVQLDAGLNNNGGTAIVCTQLSWDGGTSWTGTQQVALGGAALATYTLGGTTDTWGRTWTLSALSAANFRVRVID